MQILTTEELKSSLFVVLAAFQDLVSVNVMLYELGCLYYIIVGTVVRFLKHVSLEVVT